MHLCEYYIIFSLVLLGILFVFGGDTVIWPRKSKLDLERERIARSAAEAMGKRTEEILREATTEEEYAEIQEHVKKNGPIRVLVAPVDW